MNCQIRPVAHIENDFQTKFGLPRQSGIIEDISGLIVFEPEFADPESLRGLEEYSHLWILWLFSENVRENEHFQATVRPPVLGGNVRKGVFATRSPFRPNNIGMSVVRIEEIQFTGDRGPLIRVCGADLMNGTPIIDIKPYIPQWDSFPDAKSGFSGETEKEPLTVTWEAGVYETIHSMLTDEAMQALIRVLEEDPRPAYQDDPERIYGFEYAGLEIRFRVENRTVICLMPGICPV